MPRRRTNSTLDVQHLLNSSEFLAGFLASGVFAFLGDRHYRYTYSQNSSPAYKGKAGVVCAFRLLNKELRQEFDFLAVDWMKSAKACAIAARAAKHQFSLTPAEWAHLDHADPNYNTYIVKRSNTIFRRDQLIEYLSLVFEENVPLKEAYANDAINGKGLVLDLGDDITTFMCMITQRCQVHGPAGVHCRNVCNGNPDTHANFAVILNARTAISDRVTVYAREKCVETVSIKPTQRFLACSSPESHNGNVARAMFRMVGVHSPFLATDVCRATRCWGTHTGPCDHEDPDGHTYGTIAHTLPNSEWPSMVMLCRNPGIASELASLQELLGLTDAQAHKCIAEAKRKAQQRVAREEANRQRALKEMTEDVDAEMALSANFPVDSLEELGQVCAGMSESIHGAIKHGGHRPHGMDCSTVRNGMLTVQSYLGAGGVIDTDRALSNGQICSAEAYDYVSGMHIGRYGGGISPTWAREYGGLDGYKQFVNPTPRITHEHACRCMRFFDALDDQSLLIYESRELTSLPIKWLLSNSHMSIIVDALHVGGCDSADNSRWDTTDYAYKKLVALDGDIRRLIEVQESDIVLPNIFKKLTHTNGTMLAGGKKASESIRKWYMDCFALLVKDPSTRCAALDLVGVRPNKLLAHARDQERC